MSVVSHGPIPARILIIGEFPTDEDREANRPFASKGGAFLRKQLEQAGISLSECHLTNVFSTTPMQHLIENFCQSKTNVQLDWEEMHHWTSEMRLAQREIKKRQKAGMPIPPQRHRPLYPWAPFKKPSLYFRPRLVDKELKRLEDLILNVDPNLILCLGPAATWAVLGENCHEAFRGTICESSLVPGKKVLPIPHPISVLREWKNLPILMVDLQKAYRESLFPEIRAPSREIWINPTLEECWEFYNRFLAVGDGLLSIDIECTPSQVTCIGFAAGRRALVVPFFAESAENHCYWETLLDEQKAWAFVRAVLACPRPKLLHNGCFDGTFLARKHSLFIRNMAEDTMLLHHALQPEMKKSLGFLCSLYLNTSAWKGMRTGVKAKDASLKSDDEG